MDNYFKFFDGVPGSFILTALMSALALVLALIFKTSDRWLIFAAMLLSSFGDFALMSDFTGIFKTLPFDKFYLGAAFFGAAHIVYIIAFTTLIKDYHLKLYRFEIIAGVLLFVVTLTFIICFYFGNRINIIALFVTAVVYIALISAACTVICAAGISYGGWKYAVVLGSLSFFVSDFIIGLGILNVTNRFDHLIWWFYPIGQILLIVFG